MKHHFSIFPLHFFIHDSTAGFICEFKGNKKFIFFHFISIFPILIWKKIPGQFNNQSRRTLNWTVLWNWTVMSQRTIMDGILNRSGWLWAIFTVDRQFWCKCPSSLVLNLRRCWSTRWSSGSVTVQFLAIHLKSFKLSILTPIDRPFLPKMVYFDSRPSTLDLNEFDYYHTSFRHGFPKVIYVTIKVL